MMGKTIRAESDKQAKAPPPHQSRKRCDLCGVVFPESDLELTRDGMGRELARLCPDCIVVGV